MRTPAGHRVEHPGDLVQIDTVDIRPPEPAILLKQFTARDVASRWDTLELRRNATAASAVPILDALAERMPFPVRAISIDNGSEFMADFEQACAQRHPAVRAAAPFPKLHGAVERANRTHTEEFYEVTDAEPDLASLQEALRDWEITYNTSDPTRPWATSPRPSTWPRWGSTCNGRAGRVHPLARAPTFG